MKNVGIIAEYNPLHSGHIYHMTNSLPEEHNVIVAMSGNFTAVSYTHLTLPTIGG